jgi:hypothetical protein
MKIRYAVEWLTSFLNHHDKHAKIVVFAHHRDVLNGIQNGLEQFYLKEQKCAQNQPSSPAMPKRPAVLVQKQEPPYLRIDGLTPSKVREQHLRAFARCPSVRVILISVTASAVGIDLTAASYAFFAELPPDATWLRQAEDRLHRRGQSKNITSYVLLAHDTMKKTKTKLKSPAKKKRDVPKRAKTPRQQFTAAELEDVVQIKPESKCKTTLTPPPSPLDAKSNIADCSPSTFNAGVMTPVGNRTPDHPPAFGDKDEVDLACACEAFDLRSWQRMACQLNQFQNIIDDGFKGETVAPLDVTRVVDVRFGTPSRPVLKPNASSTTIAIGVASAPPQISVDVFSSTEFSGPTTATTAEDHMVPIVVVSPTVKLKPCESETQKRDIERDTVADVSFAVSENTGRVHCFSGEGESALPLHVNFSVDEIVDAEEDMEQQCQQKVVVHTFFQF